MRRESLATISCILALSVPLGLAHSQTRCKLGINSNNPPRRELLRGVKLYTRLRLLLSTLPALLVYALWSVSPSLSLCTPARVASLYALPQASAPSQRQPPRPPVRAPSSAGGPARDGATKRGLVSPQTWIRLTCKASTRPSVDARRCAVRRRSSDGAMTVRCGAGRSVQGRDERHLLPLS